MSIVLASSSPYRQQLLQRLQLSFIADSPDIDETPLPNESPIELVTRLARLKAEATAKRHPGKIIIASDQVGVDPYGTILTKPGTRDAAIEQLMRYPNNQISFLTSLYTGTTEQHCLDVVSYDVGFRDLTRDQIEAYVDMEQPFDCAGSFKAEGLGSALFSYQRGDDPTSLIGLPLIKLCEHLDSLGYDVLGRHN
ncbi:Maf family protein [Salinibius halmophilus]|uniref:Maf family protein n=1 Tax=Salinibius halmophilus TaxID=1853216 RepID=UPI000E672F5B|nr:nucleoside triphosphate pyrophosphatase [Salinibius halmophilus]